MLIRFDDGLKKQEFYFPTQDGRFGKILELDDPTLLLDPVRIGQTDEGKAILDSFGSSPIIFDYKGTQNVWDPSQKGTWPPSIDTFLFLNSLDKYNFNDVSNICDVACGTGIIGQHLYSNLDLEKLTLSDINVNAVNTAINNLVRQSQIKGYDPASISSRRINNGIKLKMGDIDLYFFVDDTFNSLEGNVEYDLVTSSAPPYVPIPEGLDGELMGGNEPLLKIINESSRYLSERGKLIVSYDNLSSDDVYETAQNSGMEIRELAKMNSPFRFQPALENGDWLEYLEDSGLKREEKDGYDYWHTMIVSEISK